MTHRPLTVVVVCALAAVLAGDVAVVAVRATRSDPEPRSSPLSAPRPPPPADAPPSSRLSEELPRLQAFVEGARGLRFKQPVDVEFMTDREFEEELLGDDDFEPVESDDFFVDFLRALGLVRGALEAEAVSGVAGVDHILGFYDPETEELYVRGADPSPFLRSVLVHELTHALEDQHFDLLRPELDERNDETGESFRALIEGSATLVETRYLESLPAAEREGAAREEDTAVPSDGDVPEGVLRLFAYPYVVGSAFVEELTATGGAAALDRAIRSPPVTSEQVLHPERYQAREQPAPVPSPRPDAQVIDRGSLGELMLYAMLFEAAGQEVARAAADGWGGDRYVAWRQGSRTCVRWNVVMDTPAEATELLDALTPWAARNRSATVAGANPVVIANCA